MELSQKTDYKTLHFYTNADFKPLFMRLSCPMSKISNNKHCRKTEKFTMIELTLLPGRSSRMKKAAISEITRLLGERLEIATTDIVIIINEPPLENWALRGQQASEMGLLYKKE